MQEKSVPKRTLLATLNQQVAFFSITRLPKHSILPEPKAKILTNSWKRGFKKYLWPVQDSRCQLENKSHVQAKLKILISNTQVSTKILHN